MNLSDHAKLSADVRRAADYADQISADLRKINLGPVWDHDLAECVKRVDQSLHALALALGKTLITRPEHPIK